MAELARTIPRTLVRSLPYVLGVLCWVVLASILVPGDKGGLAACARGVYRDPVTGRDAGFGGVTPLPDGRVLCPRR